MRPGRDRGMILADVLVAAFILAVGLSAFAGLFVQQFRLSQALGHREQAVCFAAAGLEELRNWGAAEWTTANLEDAADPAELEMEGVQYRRTVTLRPRPDLDPAGKLLEAEVRVEWTDPPGPGQVALVTYFAVDTDIEGLR